MAIRVQDLLMGALPELRIHPIHQWIRASVGDTLVADTRAPVVVWEPRRVVTSYAVPVADVRAELVPAPPSEDHDQLLLDWDTGHRSPPRPVRPHRLPAQQPVTPWS